MERLLAAIAANPEAVENWLVYADWLAEQGDPRGELINIELAIEAGATDPGLVERQREILRDEDALLGPRLRAEAHHLELELKRGFIHAARVFGAADDPPTRETLRALLADPHCLLDRLTFDQCGSLVAGARHARLRSLELVGYDTELPLARSFPRLRELLLNSVLLVDGSVARDPLHRPTPVCQFVVADAASLERLEHPTLERLVGTCPALADGAFDLPSLTSLHVDHEWHALLAPRSIMHRPPPALVALAIAGDVTGLRALRETPLFSQLTRLTIEPSDEVIDELCANAAAYAHVVICCVHAVGTAQRRDALAAKIRARLPAAEIAILVPVEPGR